MLFIDGERGSGVRLLTDGEGLEPAEAPLSAPARHLSNASDQDGKETVLPDGTSPGSEDTVTQSERYRWYRIRLRASTSVGRLSVKMKRLITFSDLLTTVEWCSSTSRLCAYLLNYP